MAVIISDATNQKFLAELFSGAQIDDIRENATRLDVVEAVANGAAFLRANHFLTERMVDMAIQGTAAEAVNQTIHDSEKLLNAGANWKEITALAINANSRQEVQDFLKAAQKAQQANQDDDLGTGAKLELNGHLTELKQRLCPQSAPATPVGEQKNPTSREPALA